MPASPYTFRQYVTTNRMGWRILHGYHVCVGGKPIALIWGSVYMSGTPHERRTWKPWGQHEPECDTRDELARILYDRWKARQPA